MAPIATAYNIPTDVKVSYQDAAELLTAAKANVLAEFDRDIDEIRSWFFEGKDYDEATIDARYPEWIDSIITNSILGIHKQADRYRLIFPTLLHRVSVHNPEEYSTAEFAYPIGYFLVMAARAATRADTTELDVTVGLAGVTNAAKAISRGLRDGFIARYQVMYMLNVEPEDSYERATIFTDCRLRPVLNVAKHVLLERVRRGGWVLHPDLKKMMDDKIYPYLPNLDITPSLPEGPAYHPDTWMRADPVEPPI